MLTADVFLANRRIGLVVRHVALDRHHDVHALATREFVCEVEPTPSPPRQSSALKARSARLGLLTVTG